MIAGSISLATVFLLAWLSVRDYLALTRNGETGDFVHRQMFRHSRYALAMLVAGLAITAGLVISSGPELFSLMALVLVFTALWPAMGAAGNVLAASIRWPRSSRPVQWKQVVLLAIGLTGVGQGMRLLISWQPTDSLAKVADNVGEGGPLAGICFLCLMLVMAAYEEMLFRHYLLTKLQTAIARHIPQAAATALSIVLTSLLFAAWHWDMVEPAWMKPTQTFIYGLGFSWARITYGTRAAIGAHVGLNALVIATTLATGAGS